MQQLYLKITSRPISLAFPHSFNFPSCNTNLENLISTQFLLYTKNYDEEIFFLLSAQGKKTIFTYRVPEPNALLSACYSSNGAGVDSSCPNW